MSNTLDYTLTRKQTKCFDYLSDKKTRYILYGGAKGGGKSYLLCIWVLHQAMHLVKKFKLKPSTEPLPVGFIGRKRGNDFKKTTLETWKRFIPSSVYRIREQAGEIILFNGACKIFFGGLDNIDTVNKFNSAELAFFAIDQAEETTREDVGVIRGALRLSYKNIFPKYKELYTANPSDCWLKEDFIDTPQEGHVYIPALPTDNPHLPDDYIQTLETAFKYSQPLLKAYRDGDWSSLKSTNTLLSSEDINSLKGLSFAFPQEKRVIACDPATSYDECVVYYMRDYKIEDQMIIVGEQDTMKIAGHIVAFARKHSVHDIGGDSIGLGKGIFDRITELGDFTVHPINSAKSSNSTHLKNMRTKVYWNMMQAVLDKRVYYPDDEELRRQIVNITYEVTNSSGTIIITDKDKIKNKIGRSPDRADCFAYGIYISDQAEPYTTKTVDAYDFDYVDDYAFNPATV